MSDVPAIIVTRGNRIYVGKSTQRSYGRVGNGMLIYVDPADLRADKKYLRAVDPGDVATSAAALGAKVLKRASIGGQLTTPLASARRVLSRAEILARGQREFTANEIVGGM